ncbi:methylmalonyl-CoA mutase family protein [Hellea balneolensis]|uniref:methylmalonyl-CoA mutase family protein n=1 Tax=Hellea balneolensis TaxID=287478 RepID=UPI0004075BFD|nr:methylmalonyl-CoA mutase family protein [Hellea balneolensis]
MSNFELTDNFPSSSQESWQALVEKGLRGADLDSLMRITDDGLARGPLSTLNERPQDIAALPRAGAPLLEGRAWHITAPVQDPEIAHANKQALEDLTGGASALRITLGDKGVQIKNANEMKRLMDKVYSELIPIMIAPNNDIRNAELFKDFKTADICLGLGPKTEGLTELAEELPETWRLITINAAGVHDRGGTEAQELAYLAASATHAYRTLGQSGAKHIGVELSASQDGHLTIAKLRAARRIYARIAESFGVKESALSISVVTSKRMMQSKDPWTNMLRVMSAGFGAVIGGADFIMARPFTDAIGLATPFGHRIARNMQLMMMEESHLGQVKDAAYGSYFHERMTESLAQKAWAEFQQIESEGGIENIDAFKTRIEAAAKARKDKANPILGVNLHTLEKDSTAYREAKVRRVPS